MVNGPLMLGGELAIVVKIKVTVNQNLMTALFGRGLHAYKSVVHSF